MALGEILGDLVSVVGDKWGKDLGLQRCGQDLQHCLTQG